MVTDEIMRSLGSSTGSFYDIIVNYITVGEVIDVMVNVIFDTFFAYCVEFNIRVLWDEERSY